MNKGNINVGVGEPPVGASNVSYFAHEPSFCETYYQEGIFVFLLICLVLLIIFVIKSRKNKKTTDYFYYFVDRIALISFLLGCLFVALNTSQRFYECAVYYISGTARFNVAALHLSQISYKFIFPCGVSLIAVIVSAIFKLIMYLYFTPSYLIYHLIYLPN